MVYQAPAAYDEEMQAGHRCRIKGSGDDYMAYLVDRTCTEVVKGSGARVSKPFRDRRSRGAYVLLGDPGSGKTQTFVAEANACNGHYITARDFLALTRPLPTHAQGKLYS